MSLSFRVVPQRRLQAVVVIGPQGETGANGPSNITNDTDTDISGFLVGANGKVRGATNEEIVTQAELTAALSAFLATSGGELTGSLSFSGTTHAGIRLNNLTTAQRDAITAAAGALVWNTTTNRVNIHNGTGWTNGFARVDGDTFTGNVTAPNIISSGFVEVRNGSDFARITRSAGALGRLVISRPNEPGVSSVEIGGGNDEISIRGGAGSLRHSGALFVIQSVSGLSLSGLSGGIDIASDGIVLTSNANIVELRRTTNPQGLLVQNRWTSATNRETGFLRWVNDVLQVGTEKGSLGGSARAMALQIDGTDRVQVSTLGMRVINGNSNAATSGLTLFNPNGTSGRVGQWLMGWPGNFDNSMIGMQNGTVFVYIDDTAVNFNRTVSFVGAERDITHANNGGNLIRFSTVDNSTRVSGANLVRLQIGAQDRFVVTDTQFIVGSNPSIHSSIFGFQSTTFTAPIVGGRGVTIFGRNNVSDAAHVGIGGEAFSATSAGNILLLIGNTFAPTSGTATYHTVRLTPTINQTGGANGITRGFAVEPTLTAAADWRSFDTSVNTGFAYHSSGTAPSRFGGGLTWTPFTTAQTPAANGQATLEMLSNTTGNLVYRGSDGVTRRMALNFN